MSIEPERPVEKLLKSYAKQRREQTGDLPPLHPAARRQLLSEASKRYGQAQGTLSWRLVLKGFWPRVAVGVAGMAVLIVSAAIWTSSEHSNRNAPEIQMAKSEGIRSTGTALRLEPAAGRLSDADTTKKDLSTAQLAATVALSDATATNVPAPNLVAEVETKSEVQPKEMPEQAAIVTTLASRAPAGAGESSRTTPASSRSDKDAKSALAGGSAQFRKSVADSLTVAAPPGAIVASERAANISNREQSAPTQRQAFAFQNSNSNQLFSNRAYSNGQMQPTAVMTQFKLEQEGQILRIIDQDGSIYTGSLELAAYDGTPAPTAAAARRTLQKAKGTETVQNISQQGQHFRVEVSGTNITLNQKVVFVGNLTGNNVAITGNFQNQAPSLQNSKQQQLLNLIRLSGKVRVGSGADLPVEAVPLQ
jgi:hypothetical protein